MFVHEQHGPLLFAAASPAQQTACELAGKPHIVTAASPAPSLGGRRRAPGVRQVTGARRQVAGRACASGGVRDGRGGDGVQKRRLLERWNGRRGGGRGDFDAERSIQDICQE